MAIDSRAKRMSAILVGLPFRGPMVYAPDAGFAQGERQAAAFMYSGILAGVAAAVGPIHMLCASILITMKLTAGLTITPTLNGNVDIDNC